MAFCRNFMKANFFYTTVVREFTSKRLQATALFRKILVKYTFFPVSKQRIHRPEFLAFVSIKAKLI